VDEWESNSAEVQIGMSWNRCKPVPRAICAPVQLCINYIKGCRVHVLKCATANCKGKANSRMVRRYLDTRDAKSSSNLCKHAKGCWTVSADGRRYPGWPVFIKDQKPRLLTIWKGHLDSVTQQTISALQECMRH